MSLNVIIRAETLRRLIWVVFGRLSQKVPSEMSAQRGLKLAYAVWPVFCVLMKKLCILGELKCAQWWFHTDCTDLCLAHMCEGIFSDVATLIMTNIPECKHYLSRVIFNTWASPNINRFYDIWNQRRLWSSWAPTILWVNENYIIWCSKSTPTQNNLYHVLTSTFRHNGEKYRSRSDSTNAQTDQRYPH